MICTACSLKSGSASCCLSRFFVAASRGAGRSKAASTATSTDREVVRYRVRRGDTLSSIAEEHGTTVRKLQAWNGLKGTRITAGAVLRIYPD